MRLIGLAFIAFGLGFFAICVLGLLLPDVALVGSIKPWALLLWLGLATAGILIMRLFPKQVIPPENEFINVTGLDNEVEALLLDSALSQRGVPHVMMSFYDPAYDGCFQIQKGWGLVRGPRLAAKAILETLADVRVQIPVPSETEKRG